MAKIPYYFETPVPTYFRENGWFDDENTFKFIAWAFSKCSPEPRKIFVHGKEIILAPFEFIAGRLSSPKECYMTEKQWRGQLLGQLKAGNLKKTANSKANKFSCYVWMVQQFTSKNIDSMANKRANRGSKKGPTEGHNLEDKKIFKKDHPSIPSFDDDDFSSKIEIIPGIFLTQGDLEACVKLKGTLDSVKEAIEFIQNSKKRKHPIIDWVNALTQWKIMNKTKVRIEENIALAARLIKQFEHFEQGNGWRCRDYLENVKDQSGLLFECENAHEKSIFIGYSDCEFEEKCRHTVKDKIVGI